MVEIRAYQEGDVAALGLVQAAQEAELQAAGPGVEATLMASPAWAIEGPDGVLAVGGFSRLPLLPHRAAAWALVSARMTAAQRVQAVRIAARLLRQARWLGLERIEACVLSGWRDGERVMVALGFESEARGMRKFGPGGSDYDQWVRVS